MSSSEAIHPNINSTLAGKGTVQRIRFVPQPLPDQEVLARFLDPSPRHAVRLGAESDSLPTPPGSAIVDGVDVLTIPHPPKDYLEWSDDLRRWVAESAPTGSALPVAVTIHGAQIVWSPERAVILATPERVEPFLRVLIDFCYYENELRKLEKEIGENWPLLESDTPLAHDVATLDLERFANVGQRLEQTLKRRMRLARIEPHLYQPRFHLTPLENQLLERLREKAHVEDRAEAVDSQLEVFEHVYEMNSQKIADFNIARQERTLEWIIIVLLATETLLLLFDLMWTVSV